MPDNFIMKRNSLLIICLLILGGCATPRFNYFGATPREEGKYPAFTAMDSIKGFLDMYRAAYDVTSYDLDIVLETGRKRIEGKVDIRFRALLPLRTIRFDLNRALGIRSVRMNGLPLTYRRKERAVYADLPFPMVPDSCYSVIIAYGGHPPTAKDPPWKGGFVWKKDKRGNPWVGVTCESEGGSTWFPCKDHLSDEPDSVRLHMTVPAGLAVVSNGKMESHLSAGDREEFTWSTHYPINIYNVTFYAGKFEHISDSMPAGDAFLHLDYYVMPENLEKARLHFSQVRDVIGVYSKCFGPYPWMKEGYKLVESPYEGMENQTAIAYGNGYKDIPMLGGDYIIIHETAHEWWGNAVSVSDFSDIWLQEGFATYAEALYCESKKGYDTSLVYINFWLASTIRNKFPIVGPRNVSYWDYRDGDVYGKGALILHTIRNVINDSTLFFDVLQTFFREHSAGSHVTTEDFKEVLERKTGKKWDKFFEAYLYRREVPVLKWYYGSRYPGPDKNGIRRNPTAFVVAKWTNVPEGFSMPVTLNCRDSRASETINVTTRASLSYLGKFSSCDRLMCNRKRSYFTAVTEADLLREAVPVQPDSKKKDVIASTPVRYNSGNHR